MTVVKRFMVVLLASAAVTSTTMFLVSQPSSPMVVLIPSIKMALQIESNIERVRLNEDDTQGRNNGTKQPKSLPLNVERKYNIATVEHHARELKENSDTVEPNKREHVEYDTFNIKKPFLLPFPFATQNAEDLLKNQWVKDLKKTLSEIPYKSAPISMVSSNYHYRSLLVNWLIGAKTLVDPPISNVIIFALDQELCTEILLKRKFKECIYVNPRDMLTQTVFNQIMKSNSRVALIMIMVMRLTAMRLMNHWGFDVANYDTDAIVLKNPESLYYSRDSDMVASHGTAPQYYTQKWGVGICGGMFMIKSSPKTDMYWNTMSNVKYQNSNHIRSTQCRYDDQVRLDSALDLMHPVWEGNRNISLYEWTATTREGFKVTILPEKDVCRKYCTTKSIKQCYVWHKFKYQDNKLDNGKNNLGPWYLRDDWEEISARSNAISEEWLREITIL